MATNLERSAIRSVNERRFNLLELCNDLWENVLCRVPSANTNDLWNEHLKIRLQLDEIDSIQKQLTQNDSVRSPVGSREEAIERFVDWADHMCIEMNGIRIRCSNDERGFGLETTQPIPKDTELLRVPRKAMLSWDNARKSAMLKKCFEKDMIVKTMDNVALALMVCCQKLMPNSNWIPYFNALPQAFTTPLYFTAAQMQIPCLIPVLDMANHDLNANNRQPLTVHFSVEDECACIKAASDYSVGDEVTIFYGNRSSAQFLLHNGFVADGENKFDTYKLKIGFRRDDKNGKTRLQLMYDVGFNVESRIFVFEISLGSEPVPQSLLDFALVFLTDQPSSVTIDQLRSNCELKRRAWNFLMNRFALLQRAYGSRQQKQVDSEDRLIEQMISRLKHSELRILNNAELFCAQQAKSLK
ncbi:unnamed protein product [Anisakis simplex]|uniref:protein-histidine N-methyltransferase n=1 Tax=Anisakis simplex TaxID=6269 RepID=A0A0M3JY23_ANISI|nr:unnamed protein product [Anisakis simplex]